MDCVPMMTKCHYISTTLVFGLHMTYKIEHDKKPSKEYFINKNLRYEPITFMVFNISLILNNSDDHITAVNNQKTSIITCITAMTKIIEVFCVFVCQRVEMFCQCLSKFDVCPVHSCDSFLFSELFVGSFVVEVVRVQSFYVGFAF